MASELSVRFEGQKVELEKLKKAMNKLLGEFEDQKKVR